MNSCPHFGYEKAPRVNQIANVVRLTRERPHRGDRGLPNLEQLFDQLCETLHEVGLDGDDYSLLRHGKVKTNPVIITTYLPFVIR